jgi:hypothetical protein
MGVVVLSKRLRKFTLGAFIRCPSSEGEVNGAANASHTEAKRTDNHMHPFCLAQDRSILDDILVSCKQDLELAHSDFVLQLTTLQRIALVRGHTHRWRPLRKFGGPIRHGRQRHNNEVRSALLLHLDEEMLRTRLSGSFYPPESAVASDPLFNPMRNS